MGAWLRRLLAAVSRMGCKALLCGRARLLNRSRLFRLVIMLGFAALVLVAVGAGIAQATTYAYDANGRLRAVTNSAGTSAKYVYDSMSNLLQVESVPADKLEIFAFSPDHGAAGTTVTISGQNFSATAANDIVKFNGTTATVTSASTSSLTTSVPVGSSTGKITVTMGAQSATSDDAFTVDNTGLSPVITSFSPAIGTVGTSVTVVGKHFDPVTNQTSAAIDGSKTRPTSVTDTHVQFAVSMMGSGKVSITTPFGQGLSGADFYVLPPNTCGNITANVKIMKRVTAGSSTGAMTIPMGNCAAILFEANVDGWLSLQTRGIVSSANNINYAIYDTSNQLMMSGTISTVNPSIHLPIIPVGGTYSLWIEPDTSSATLTVDLEKDLGLLTRAAGSATATSVDGQTKRLTFSASTGNNLGLGISNLITSGSSSVSVDVYDIYGMFVAAVKNPMTGGDRCYVSYHGCDANLFDIRGGSYQVLVSPGGSYTMSFTATLSSDVAVTLSLNKGVTLNINRRGQNANISFNAVAGQTLALKVSNGITVPAGNDTNLTFFSPDGTQMFGDHYWSDDLVNLLSLAQTGSYRIYVDPSFGSLSSQVLKLLPVPAIPLTADGSTQVISNAVPGEDVLMTFSAFAGENVGFGIGNLTESPDGYMPLNVYDSNGMWINGTTTCNTIYHVCGVDLQNLAAGGYQIVATASQITDVISFNGTLSQDLTESLPLNVPVTVNLHNGQTATLSFVADAGDTFALQGADYSSAYYLEYTPDGNAYDTDGYAFSWQMPDLPQTGTYHIYIAPEMGNALTQVLELVPGAVGTLAIGGPPQGFVTTAQGQYVYLNFVAAADEHLEIKLTDLHVSASVNVVIEAYDPNGVFISEIHCPPDSGVCALDIQSLAAGSYQATAIPAGPNTMDFQAALLQQ